MTDLVEFLNAQYDRIEQAARAACEYASAEWHLEEEFGETVLWWPPEPHVAENERRHGIPVTADVWRGQTIESSGQRIAPHIALHDPASVLADIESKRAVINEVMSWKHDYVDGDTWFSCGLAESPDFPEEGPGSGCADDSKRGTCSCGLAYRQRRILAPLAAPFSGEPGYKEEWAVE